MDSQRKTFEMLDYDKMAMASMDNVNLAVYSGQANINLGDGGDPNALLEPHEQDIYPEGETNNTGQLSYKKVKIHQYKYHPRDRKNKIKFPWFSTDLSYIPCCRG